MQEGIIVKNISNQYIVESKDKMYSCIARGRFKKEGELTPVVGDYVEIEIHDQDTATIQEILPRDNYIKRPKLANITQMVYVLSTKMPKPDLLLLDKQLAFAEYLDIPAIIVVNKIDLDMAEEIEEIYTKMEYPVIKTIAKEKEGIWQLQEVLQNQISAFSGNSGVGKSTLLNALMGTTMTEEGDISKKNERGKNTTTAISLYPLKENTYIADTPGFSTFDIFEIQKEDLAFYFKDLKQHIINCKFGSCTHVKEQNCGIKKALQDGEIAQSRYDNYVKIYEELKDREEHKW